MRMFLRPRWIVTHLVVLAIAATFVSLGLWQLRRLDAVRADNARIVANMSAAPQTLDATLATYGNDPDTLIYRRVVVEGTYQPAEEVLLTPRSNGRTAGHHVATPLLTGDGQAVLVDRGWVPFDDDQPPIEAAPPPAGPVTVTGILLPTSPAARYGTTGDSDRITYLSGADTDLLQPQVAASLQPFSVLLQEQDPPSGDLPVPAAAPQVDEGSHQSYAWQWFSFTVILLVGYPLLLRRSLNAAADRQGREV